MSDVQPQETTKVAETTKIMDCNCQAHFQDKRYGAGKRLHNTGYKGKAIKGYTCTVCGQFKAA